MSRFKTQLWRLMGKSSPASKEGLLFSPILRSVFSSPKDTTPLTFQNRLGLLHAQSCQGCSLPASIQTILLQTLRVHSPSCERGSESGEYSNMSTGDQAELVINSTCKILDPRQQQVPAPCTEESTSRPYSSNS